MPRRGTAGPAHGARRSRSIAPVAPRHRTWTRRRAGHPAYRPHRVSWVPPGRESLPSNSDRSGLRSRAPTPAKDTSHLERGAPGRLLLAGILALITLIPAAIAPVSICHIFSYPDQEQIGSVTTVRKYFLPLRSYNERPTSRSLRSAS